VTEHRAALTKRLHLQAIVITLGILTFAYGAIVGFWSSRVEEGQAQPWGLTLLITAGVVVLMPSVLVATLMYWRRLDEAAKEAHKWAWYWGGSLGMIPPFVVVGAGDRGVELAGRLGYVEPSDLIFFGAASVLASMMAGYVLAWAVWWLRKR